MAARRSGLGKGLDSLIPASGAKVIKEAPKSEAPEEKGKEVFVKLSKVEPNKEQPRKSFDEDALNELAESIRQFGVITPLIVQDQGDHYEIVAGERRWRAARIAGLKEVPVIIRQYSEVELAEIALIENIQRENLNPIEEALAYARLIEEFHLKQDEVAQRVSKSRSAITNAMRLLKLPEQIQQLLAAEKLSMGHARALLGLADADKQLALAEKIIAQDLSVREVEKAVKVMNEEPPVKPEKKKDEQLELIYKSYESRLAEALGTKVSIVNKGKGSGRFEISFYSVEEFERILEKISRN